MTSLIDPSIILADTNKVEMDQVHDRRIVLQLREGERFNPRELGLIWEETPSTLEKNNYQIVRIPDSLDFYEMLEKIRSHNSVLVADPDFIQDSSDMTFNLESDKDWFLEHINLPRNWDYYGEISPVIVAVLDTGINANHHEFEGRLTEGYNVLTQDSNTNDDNGHGTLVSGVIAAVTDKDYLGVELNTKIMPIKIMDNKGQSSIANTVAGIYYAMENGADIINMSFTSDHDSRVQKQAIMDAYQQGIILIAAAGNDAKVENSYPASYGQVISVTSVGREDVSSDFSNYGDFVDISAPGEDIAGPYLEDNYAVASGTSFSAPIVSGVAALLKSIHPEWTSPELEWVLEESAEANEGSPWDVYKGYGTIDVQKALETTIPLWSEDVGNYKSTAELLVSNQSYFEKIDYPSDEDWFHFQVEKGTNTTVSILNPIGFIDIAATLYTPTGNVVKINNGGKGLDENYTFFAEKGDYYLQIVEGYHHWSNDAYELRIEVEGQVGSKQEINGTQFSDVSRYHTPINYLTDLGIIKGYPDSTFKPQQSVTRLQAVNMILNEMGIDVGNTTVKDPGFKDVSPNSYGYKAIAKAVEIGFIKGKEDGNFDPSGSLTRGQMAAILVQAYNLSGNSVNDFSDVPKGHWAYDVVNKLSGSGVTKGFPDNTFRPNEIVSREHFSLFLYNYLNL